MKRKIVGAFSWVVGCVGVALADPTAQLADPLEWLYPDSQVGAVRALDAVDVPANGVAEVNVLLNGLDPEAPLSFSCDASGAEWFRYVAVPVQQNTGLNGGAAKPGVTNNVYVTRRAPFWVYDALEPLAADAVRPGAATAALRLRLRRFAGAGEQSVKLAVAQGAFRRAFTFRVTVHDVQVPAVGRASYRYTNWMNFHSMATCHGLEPWSEAHWKMIDAYVRLAVYGRQNMVMLPDFRKNWSAGSPEYDEAKYRRLVDLLTRAGVWYLEGPHLCGFSTGHWGAPAFVPHGVTNHTTSAQGAAYLGRLAANMAALVERNGWKDRWYQHVADEPSKENATEYRLTCGIVRKYMPGIRLTDAVELPELGGALDAYCPKNYKYEEFRADYDKLRVTPSDEIWCYTCMFPGGRWLNRLLDNEVLRPVLLGWGCSQFGLDGYLHWGYNQFSPESDPLKRSIVRDEHMDANLPPGDRNIVYAGKTGPWPSVRLEAMRQGFEDLELLKMLAARDKARADALTKKLVRGFGDYEKDPAAYRAVRRELLAASAATAACGSAKPAILNHVIHRGWGLAWPENSLIAIRQCWEAGFIPEADARVSKDGVLIAFHDAAYKGRPIGEMTWAEIEKINIAERKGKDWQGRTVQAPTWDAIFAEMAKDPNRRIAMDHKCVPNATMLACAKKYGVEKQVWNCSGSPVLAREWKRLLPGGRTLVWIYNGQWAPVNFDDAAQYAKCSAKIKETFEKIAADKFEGIDMVELIVHADLTKPEPFCPESAFLKDAFARIRAAGKIPCALVWTDGEKVDVYGKLAALGAEALGTDYPVALQRHLGKGD